MDPNGFLTALNEFSVILAGDAVEALLDFWNGEMVSVVDVITYMCLLPLSGAKLLPGLLGGW